MENQIEYYHFAIEKLLPVIQKRSKLSCITFAIALIAVQQIYSFFRVPKNLRQFPRVSYFSMAKSFLTRESPTDRFKRIILPVVNKGNGFYVSKVPFVWTVYVTNPVVAKQLLLKSDIFPKNHAVFHQIGENSPFSQFLGIDNVAISNGDVWKKQRKVMNPAFHRSLPIKTMVSVLNTLVSVIDKSDGPVPITSAMQNFTLDVLGLAIFGFEFKALQGDPDNWTRTYKTVIDSLFDPVINVFATFDTLLTWVYPKRRECAVAIKKMNLKFDELARQKRAEVKSGAYANVPDHEKDLLTLMLEAMEKGEALTSDDELRHNIAVFFLAGHGTTAHTLSFCFYHLAKNKHVQRKLREEIISVLGDEPVDIVPSLEQMKNMKYMNLVIKENLRMNTPADTLFTRDTVKDISLAGQFIPKDTAISIDINAIHHDPKYWHNPEHFIPERFGEGGEQESHEGLTWLPFSNGSRQCIGMNFSLAEQRLVLAMLVRKYEIDIPKDSIHYERLIFDRPGNIAPLSLGLTFTKRY